MRYTNNGFTLVETLVALTLLGIGVAAWVTTSTLAIRITGAAARESAANHRTRSRAEALAGGSCARAVSGAAGAETWTVRPLANGLRLVRVAAPFVDESRQREATYELAIAC